MKKTLILLTSLGAFLISCHTEAASTSFIINTNSVENSVKIEVSKPLNLPIPTASPMLTPKSVSGINSKVGIVDVNDDQTICFRTKNSNLAEKTPVSIIISLYEFPQKVLSATIEKKLEKSCVGHDSDAGDSNEGEDFYYLLVLSDKTIENSEVEIGIGLIQPSKEIQVQNKLANVDLTSDGNPEFFRLCASNEGLHLTIWSGKPLKGKRIWHYYYYLHYDTEPDCKKKDYEGVKD